MQDLALISAGDVFDDSAEVPGSRRDAYSEAQYMHVNSLVAVSEEAVIYQVLAN